MSEGSESGSERSDQQLPDWALGSEHLGVRAWTVNGSSQQQLVDQIAVILGEHMNVSDELHVSYSVVQNGSTERRGSRFDKNQPSQPWTELFFQYSALIVLRPTAQ